MIAEANLQNSWFPEHLNMKNAEKIFLWVHYLKNPDDNYYKYPPDIFLDYYYPKDY